MDAACDLTWPRGLDRLSLGQISRLTGIAKPNLSRHRSGARQPGVWAWARLDDAAAAEHPVMLTGLATAPRYAVHVRDALNGGHEDPVALTRLARQVLQDATLVADPGDRRAFLGTPVRLRSSLWNAFVAALAAYAAHRVFGQPAPSWTNGPGAFLLEPLSPFPGLGEDQLWWEWVNTEPEFAARRVALHRENLRWI
jgi:hypothetical protein